MFKKVMEHITAGLAIGFVVTTACLWLFGVYEESGMFVMRQFTTWLAASALYGLISVIYDTPIPFSMTFAIHFVLCAGVTFAASAVSGLFSLMQWYEWFKYVFPVFVAIYAVISIGLTVLGHCQARKINKKMSRK